MFILLAFPTFHLELVANSNHRDLSESPADRSGRPQITAVTMADQLLFILLLTTVVSHVESDTISFDAAAHMRYMELTWAAYCPPANLSKWSCYWCKDQSVR